MRVSASVFEIGMGVSALGSVAGTRASAADGAVDALGVDVEVGDEAQAIEARGEHAARLQVRDQAGGALAVQVGEDDVGLRRLDREAGQALQAFGEAGAERVVVGEAVDVMLERVAAPRRRRRRPGACRRRPSCASGAPPAMNSREPTSAEPTGAPRPFEKQTETLSNGARSPRRRARIAPSCDRGVEEARAVEVRRQAALLREPRVAASR